MTLHVRDRGDGPVALLLHAFPCDGSLWGAQAEALLAEGWRVVVPDLPGFGASGLPPEAPDLGVVVGDLLAWLDGHRIERGLLAGCSLGGYVAMGLLRRRPGWATALVLTGTKATADTAEAAAGRERLASLVEEDPAETARILEHAVLPGLLGPTSRATRPDVVARVRDWIAGADAATVAWYQRAMAGRPDSLDVLGAVEAPAVLPWGLEDALSPRVEQEAMLRVLPAGVLDEIDGAGHLALVERPEAVTAAVLDVARRATGPRPA